MRDDGGHARPVFELARLDELVAHRVFFVLGAGEARGVVVDGEGDVAGAADELDGDVGGEQSRDDDGGGVDPEDGNPGGDDVHEVRGAAGDDEHGEADDKEDPVAGHDREGAPGDVKQGAANAEVAEEGEEIGDHHRPDEAGGPRPSRQREA